jgi:hypothetical protein
MLFNVLEPQPSTLCVALLTLALGACTGELKPGDAAQDVNPCITSNGVGYATVQCEGDLSVALEPLGRLILAARSEATRSGVVTTGSVDLNDTADDDLGKVEVTTQEGEIIVNSVGDGSVGLSIALENDGIWVSSTQTEGRDQQLIHCEGFTAYVNRLIDGGEPESCGGSSTWENADEEVGCFTCPDLGDYLASDPLHGALEGGDALSVAKAASAHLLVEEEVKLMAADPANRGAVIAAITAIASVFRVAFDSDGYYAEIGSQPSGTWNEGGFDVGRRQR